MKIYIYIYLNVGSLTTLVCRRNQTNDSRIPPSIETYATLENQADNSPYAVINTQSDTTGMFTITNIKLGTNIH